MAEFSPDEIQDVWEKGEVVEFVDKNVWRKDQCGAWINRFDYGNRQSNFGWECDHITPKSKNGSDSLFNLRPLHWLNNASRQNGRLRPAVTSDGLKNIRVE